MFSLHSILVRASIAVPHGVRLLTPTPEQGWKEKVKENFYQLSLSSVSLDRDPELSMQLNSMAEVAAENLFQILKPLFTMGLTAVAEPELEDFRYICSSIAEVAIRLKVQLFARSRSNRIIFFWSSPGQKFDHTLHNPCDGSGDTMGEARKVKIARFWGIEKRDLETGQYSILAKSECELVEVEDSK